MFTSDLPPPHTHPGQVAGWSQHSSREDTIRQTISSEKSDFEGCGLEMPDLLDPDNFQYFSNWNGELRFVQNIKLRRFRKSELERSDTSNDVMET